MFLHRVIERILVEIYILPIYFELLNVFPEIYESTNSFQNTKLRHSLTISEEARTRTDSTIFLFHQFKPDLEEIIGRSEKLVGSILISSNDVDTAREQISKVNQEHHLHWFSHIHDSYD